MFTLRPARERGHVQHGWLDTWHTFSFASYRDPAHMGFRSLRVMNEDFVAPGQGFGLHPHRDMEILTYVLSGSLEHRDSLGSGGVIRGGDWQRMTAGSGIEHSEFNPSPDEPVHLYQIWIFPSEKGLTPEYEDRPASGAAQPGWQLIASPDGRGGSMRIHQDATLSVGRLTPAQPLTHEFASGRFGWLQVVRGSVQAGPYTLRPGDGLAINAEARVDLSTPDQAEVLLFDLN